MKLIILLLSLIFVSCTTKKDIPPKYKITKYTHLNNNLDSVAFTVFSDSIVWKDHDTIISVKNDSIKLISSPFKIDTL
jgi:hypothetical protein